MDESAYKTIDRQGRVSIPAEWRRQWKTDKVMLLKRDEKIEIIPFQPTPLTSFFDSIIVDDDVDFTDPHSVERAALEKTLDEVHRR